MTKIEIELSDLKEMLNWQRQSCAEHITRNLSVYHWSNLKNGEKVNHDKARVELREEASKAPYPEDFKVLSKYIK